MIHPVCLPPRPHHTFSLRTVEKLRQQHLEDTGAYVQPKQIPALVDAVRHNLKRVEEALLYRLQYPVFESSEGKGHPSLSKFERVRVGHILADIVLDIGTISFARGNETCGVAFDTKKDFFLSTYGAGAVLSGSLSAEESHVGHRKKRQHELGPLSPDTDVVHEAVEVAPTFQPTSSSADRGSDSGSDMSAVFFRNSVRSPTGSSVFYGMQKSPIGELIRQLPNQPHKSNSTTVGAYSDGGSSNGKCTRVQSSFHDTLFQHHNSCSESPFSPTSVHFKPVMSTHSGGCSPITRQISFRQPTKRYDIDLQTLSEFTRCLCLLRRFSLTDDDFETIGLRYAIPGIRELDPNEIQFLEHLEGQRYLSNDMPARRVDEVTTKCNRLLATPIKGSEGNTRGVRLTQKESNSSFSSTYAAAVLQQSEHDVINVTQVPSFDICMRQGAKGCKTQQDRTTAYANLSIAPTHFKEQYLPLFPGGKNVTVKKKELHIFFAMVEACLKQVDQEVDGRLRAAGADLTSANSEEDHFSVA